MGKSTRTGAARVVLLTLVMATFAFAPAAVAQTSGFEIVIPLDTVIRADEGTITELQTRDVPEQFTGQFCEIAAVSRNQESVHPGNDLIVETGGTSGTLPDVEAVPGGTVEGDSLVVLGSTITVLLRMGPEEVFSAGIDVIVDCEPEDPLTQTITVVKAGSDADGTFTFDLTGTDIGGNAIDESVQLGFGESFTWDLLPGDYTLTEVENPDFDLIGASCDNGDDPSAITLEAREDITCTFENQPIPGGEPDIAVEKTADPTIVNAPGEDVTFTVEITNPSGVDVEITSIEDDVFGTLDGDTDCQVGTVLAPGGSCEFDFLGLVAGDGGDVHQNTVTVVGVDEEGTEVTDDDDAVVEIVDVAGEVIVDVTVDGVCEIQDGDARGFIDVTLPEGVSQVEISQDGEVIATLTESGRVEVELDQTYTWSATAEEDFELITTSGEVVVDSDDCPVIVDETEELPFTGFETMPVAAAGMLLLAGGAVVLRTARRHS